MGHFLGLNHQSSSSESIMRPYLDINSLERDLYSLDVTTISENYQNSSSSAIRGTTSFTIGALSGPVETNDSSDNLVRGIIELRANGECHHIINGKNIYQH